MCLDPIRAADHKHGTVQHLEAALRLRGEIRMPGRVQQRHRQIRQFEDSLFGEDRDASLALQTVGIQETVPVIHTSKFLQFSGMIEHGLGKGRFPRVNMGQYADHSFFLRIHAVDFIRWRMISQHNSIFMGNSRCDCHYYAKSCGDF